MRMVGLTVGDDPRITAFGSDSGQCSAVFGCRSVPRRLYKARVGVRPPLAVAVYGSWPRAVWAACARRASVGIRPRIRPATRRTLKPRASAICERDSHHLFRVSISESNSQDLGVDGISESRSQDLSGKFTYAADSQDLCQSVTCAIWSQDLFHLIANK